jgi:hypothetical protein
VGVLITDQRGSVAMCMGSREVFPCGLPVAERWTLSLCVSDQMLQGSVSRDLVLSGGIGAETMIGERWGP